MAAAAVMAGALVGPQGTLWIVAPTVTALQPQTRPSAPLGAGCFQRKQDPVC